MDPDPSPISPPLPLTPPSLPLAWSPARLLLAARRLPAHLTFPGALAQSLVLDTTRIRRELDYAEVVPPAEALARGIARERAHPPAGPDQRAAEYAAEDAALTHYAGV